MDKGTPMEIDEKNDMDTTLNLSMPAVPQNGLPLQPRPTGILQPRPLQPRSTGMPFQPIPETNPNDDMLYEEDMIKRILTMITPQNAANQGIKYDERKIREGIKHYYYRYLASSDSLRKRVIDVYYYIIEYAKTNYTIYPRELIKPRIPAQLESLPNYDYSPVTAQPSSILSDMRPKSPQRRSEQPSMLSNLTRRCFGRFCPKTNTDGGRRSRRRARKSRRRSRK